MRSLRLGLAAGLVALLAGFTLGACSPPSGTDSASRATALADRVMTALGGKQRWDSVHGLRWTFGSMLGDSVRSSRTHAWDRQTGQHRVEGVNRAGQHYVIIHTVGDTTSGMAWMDGQRIEDADSLHKLVKRGEALWINDSYWFLMPYKLRDPGVTLESAGDTTMDGASFDRLALSFTNVGLTPGDHYWVWVNRANQRVERWEMVLEGDAPPPVSYSWEGWQEHGGLWFPTSHRRDSIDVFTNRVEVVSSFGPAEFSQP